MNAPVAISPPRQSQLQPRAIGAATLSAQLTPRGSALDDLRQSGALKMLFPHRSDSGLQAIAINTSGGVTGGDSFSITAHAGAGAHLGITTQAAERLYRTQPGQTGTICNQLSVGPGARLDWLPQETILFDGCSCKRDMTVDLDNTASLLLVEPLIFGRAAMGEKLSSGLFHDRIDIRRQGRPLFLDAIRLQGDITRHLAAPHVADGAGALATLIYVGSDAEAHLPPLRDLLGDTAGASLIGADLLVARILATDGFSLRQTLVPALRQFTNDDIPRSWMT